jgi:hypothetical protein
MAEKPEDNRDVFEKVFEDYGPAVGGAAVGGGAVLALTRGRLKKLKRKMDAEEKIWNSPQGTRNQKEAEKSFERWADLRRLLNSARINRGTMTVAATGIGGLGAHNYSEFRKENRRK